jgi:hypothetical protein
MDDNLKTGFEYVKTLKCELDAIVIGRNDLAKWQKLNSKSYEHISR